MEKIEIWKPIPEDFFIPDLHSQVICSTCNNVFTIIYTRWWAEIKCGDISYSAKDSNTHWDMHIESSNNDVIISLQQRNELGLFILLLKYASEIWILDEIFSPNWWNFYWYLNQYTDTQTRDYINDFDMMFVNLYQQLPRNENSETAFSLWKTPHASNNRYYIHISWENDLIFTDNIGKKFVIKKHEVIQYLRILLLAADEYAGRTHHGRYLWVLNYIFSDDFQEEYGRYDC